MKISHVGIWVKDLEKSKQFYTDYFNAVSNEIYTNEKKGFKSYFLTFENECKLEIMTRIDVNKEKNSQVEEYIGVAHIAFELKSREDVINLTEKLRKNNFEIFSEPRVTGDGYFESVIFDPDNNRLELVSI